VPKTKLLSAQAQGPRPLYGISPLALAQHFRLSERSATQWKARLEKVPNDAEAISLHIHKNLGAFDDAWRGFIVRQGLLWTPEGVGVGPGEVRAIPTRQQQIAEYERAQRWMLESFHAERRREQVARNVELLLQTALEALRQR